MKAPLVSLFIATLAAPLLSAESQFEQDRSAILAMAGAFKVEFNFEEVVALVPDYELTKPYQSEAKELVKVVEDKGDEITLQHLLVVNDMDGPRVIKHWAQIWIYEDQHTLTYEGNLTWLPIEQEEDEVKGTWSQYVTQVDDSPRYKASGQWVHEGNYSSWTSEVTNRPLPRREYTRRSDYDLLKVVNRHIITPTGWVHTQDNRKYVRRNGENRSLCIEAGINTYERVTEPDEVDKEDFAAAEAYWSKTFPFWAEVRGVWNKNIHEVAGPVSYRSRLNPKDKQNLMARMGDLAQTFTSDPDAAGRAQIEELLSEHLQ
ncbi:MAG: DUF6607 family protein [Roseibacillus sp.]